MKKINARLKSSPVSLNSLEGSIIFPSLTQSRFLPCRLALALLLNGCGAGATDSAAAAATPAFLPVGYQLIWQDEFTGGGVDGNKWNIGTATRDAAVQTTSAVRIGSNGLEIRTYTDGSGAHHTGWLDSYNKYMPLYGYFEAQMRFHGASGEHCAFWMNVHTMGQYVGDAARSGTEMDIMEHREFDAQGRTINNQAPTTVHWDGYGKDHKARMSTWSAPASLDDVWHNYGMLWTPEGYTFYVDGVAHWQFSAAVSAIPEALLLTCEVKALTGGWAGAVPTDGYGPLAQSNIGMDVRYVRVYQAAH